MKKLLLTLGFLGCTLTSAFAEGTILANATGLNRIRLNFGEQERFASVGDNLTFGIFYGPLEGGFAGLTVAPQLAHVTSEAGVLTGWSGALGLPGTQSGETVLLQVRAWNENLPYEFTSRVITVALDSESGNGTPIFGINDTANRMRPVLFPVPEPSALAIGTLAGVAFAFARRRRTANRN